jgi:hypothetical protein
MRRPFVIMAMALLFAACTSPAPSPTTAPPAAVARAVDRSGPFTLVLELPADTWAAGEPITGEARLELANGARRVFGAAGGVIAFGYRELTGRRSMGALMDAACAPHGLSANTPIIAPLRPGGSWSGDDPDAGFYQAFAQGSDVRLPPGDWEIRAYAMFVDGAGCDGVLHDLEAPVVLHVR